jgi:hypothetical protein
VRSRTSKRTSKQDCAASFMGSLAGGASIMAFVLAASLASRMSRMPRMGSAGRVRSTSHTAEAKAAWTPCVARYSRDIDTREAASEYPTFPKRNVSRVSTQHCGLFDYDLSFFDSRPPSDTILMSEDRKVTRG